MAAVGFANTVEVGIQFKLPAPVNWKFTTVAVGMFTVLFQSIAPSFTP